MKKTILFLVAAVMASAFGCVPRDEDVLTVVAVLPFTDDFAGRGERYLNAMRMAVDNLEKQGVIDKLGKKIRIEVVSSGVPKEDRHLITEQVEELIKTKKVIAVFSSSGAAHESSLFPALAAKIPHFEINSGSHHEEFFFPGHPAATLGPDGTSPTAFREIYDDSFAFSPRALCYTLATVAGEYISKVHAGQKLGLLRGKKAHDVMHTTTVRQVVEENNAALQAQADAAQANGDNQLAESILAKKVDIVNTESSESSPALLLSYDVGNFGTEIQNLMAIDEPDVIFYHLRGDSTNLRFMRDLEASGFDDGIRDAETTRTKTLVTCGMSQKGALLDPVKNGNISAFLHNRLFFSNRGPISTPELSDFRAEYEELWRVDSDIFVAGAFDSVTLVVLGALSVGLDADGGIDTIKLRQAIIDVATPGGDAKTRTQLREAADLLAAGTDINYEGASGSMDFSNENTVVGEFHVARTRSLDPDTAEFEVLTDWNGDNSIIQVDSVAEREAQ